MQPSRSDNVPRAICHVREARLARLLEESQIHRGIVVVAYLVDPQRITKTRKLESTKWEDGSSPNSVSPSPFVVSLFRAVVVLAQFTERLRTGARRDRTAAPRVRTPTAAANAYAGYCGT
jgi:hypothetical protein